jgi:N6-adenosine-specific RNA methylase IME4
MTKQVVIPLFAEITKKTDNAKSFSDITSNKRFLSLLSRLEPERQQKVIEKIKNKNINDLKKAIALIKKEEFMQNIEQQKQEIESSSLKLPEGVFDVIVIDPPWPYGTKYDPAGRRCANPYPEMSIDELKKLKLPAAENSTLFLWTTHKFIRTAFELLRAWGFKYRNTLVWDKRRMGLGNLFRLQCEFCLVAFKGKPLLVNDGTFRDIIYETRRQHSRKPDAFYQMVDKLCAGRKIDYFSRQQRDGWESYGNDTEKFESKSANNIFLF